MKIQLGQQYPQLISEWHPTKNGSLLLNNFTSGSGKKAWWVCAKGHEWEAVIQSRTRGNSCPYCAGKKVLPGYNDLETMVPAIASEWHPIKNSFLPNTVSQNSNRKAWWVCAKGHEWEAVIQSRVKGNGCPFCSNRKTLSGVNDLASLFPHLISEWHPTKNDTLIPSTISANSNRKVWWVCTEGHEWEAVVANRAAKNSKCPYCTNRKPLKGYNGLSVTSSKLLKEWHPTKNLPFSPDDFTYGSHQKIWWVCAEGHEWEAVIYSRTSLKENNCPFCSSQVSQAEQEISDFLRLQGLKVEQSNRTLLKGKEIDIYLPDEKVGIEFNGLYWHTENQGKDKFYHYTKWLSAKEAGIQLIQVWEDDWNRDKDIILNGLKHKLGISTQEKIFARKTKIIHITSQEASNFLNTNHIQGFATGSYYLGLKHKTTNALQAVLILKKDSKNALNIVRYATNANVIGGFTKLLSYSTKLYAPDKYVTFSDHCISNGRLYEANGFVADKEITPDYMYLVNKTRKHKFGYRLKRFHDDPNLLWDVGLSESALAKINGLERIWDAGKTRWVKQMR